MKRKVTRAPKALQTSADWASKRVFTTGEAAAICKVSQQTIIRCFDAGRLQGFRVPGSKFRRIPREELIRFMKANGIPVEQLEGLKKKVLVVDDDLRIIELFQDLFSRDQRFDFKSAMTAFDAGILTESYRPHLLVFDYMLPEINGNVVCMRIKQNPAYEHTKVLCVSAVFDQEGVQALFDAGVSAFIHKPLKIDELMSKILELLELENQSREGILSV